MDKREILRHIPRVDDLLREPQLTALAQELSAMDLRDAVRAQLDDLRADVLSGSVTELPEPAQLASAICRRAKADTLPSLRPVVNATGVVLHTNLGRACLSQKAVDAVAAAARGYSTLEYNVEAGKRGSRHDHVEELVTRLTGAEAAMVVNNNAAAVLIILSAMGKGGEVITSRGELVEIGGSFRIPDIMVQCGCSLREVGTTNKTHIKDYREAINENTKALLKVHTSNYRIVGFSESVSLAEMAELGRETGLPVIQDLGSGSLVDLTPLGIHDEPTIQQSVKAGIDVISFSGDKLLGGPQAGVIIGRKKWIDLLKAHPLARAMRVDKMTLAALRETLYSYLDPETAMREIPTMAMLSAPSHVLKSKAGVLCQMLKDAGLEAQVIETEDQVGGGSVPTQLLPSFGVALEHGELTLEQLEAKMRLRDKPIIGRIAKERYFLDVRTLFEEDFPYIVKAACEALA